MATTTLSETEYTQLFHRKPVINYTPVLKEQKADYYKLHKDRIVRYNIVKALNNGTSKAPRFSTIKKYNLVFDKETGVWS